MEVVVGGERGVAVGGAGLGGRAGHEAAAQAAQVVRAQRAAQARPLRTLLRALPRRRRTHAPRAHARNMPLDVSRLESRVIASVTQVMS